MKYTPVIGLEIHAEMLTQSKMFCACPVVDLTIAPPNSAVCPVCAGMPGTLPVINKRAVEYALRVALALGCEINHTSIFARKNYFYPDLPKGYQISQYEEPLAEHGTLTFKTSTGEKTVRIRRVHLEEDTGKSTHVALVVEQTNGETGSNNGAPEAELRTPHENEPTPIRSNSYSLVNLNRSGVPLLEIVTEPDLHSAEEVGAYARSLRQILRYLEVNSGDMQKGVLRIEPNISVRLAGAEELGTRTEVKNLNSFRALERAVDFEVARQITVIEGGGEVLQETVGWDEAKMATFSQRGKEEAHDYRYFPEPDLPPLVVEETWIEAIRSSLPELPIAKQRRFIEQHGLKAYDAEVLTVEPEIADYFEEAVTHADGIKPKIIANWLTGELFALMKQAETEFEAIKITPENLAQLVYLVTDDQINQATGKKVLAEMFQTGEAAESIVERGLRQVSDQDAIERWVSNVLEANPDQVAAYLSGKEPVANWLFGQIMREAKGQANPQVVRQKLMGRLSQRKEGTNDKA